MGYGDGGYGDPFPPAVTTGGIPVALPGTPPGALIGGPFEVQYGDMLLGGRSLAGWRDLIGWRNLPEAYVSDTLRPQALGAYPGDVIGGSLAVTFVFLLLADSLDDRSGALATIERYAPQDGIDRPLVVDDGGGPSVRMARVIGRVLPQTRHHRHVSWECSLQFLCADPRRYSLTEAVVPVALAASVGGLAYPLAYPLAYGTSAGGAVTVDNAGTTRAPAVVRFFGPLVNPTLTCSAGWRLAFRLNLADGETLVVDTANGTALLDNAVDRLYTIDPLSSPLEACTLPAGPSSLGLAAAAGTGSATVTYRHAYL